MKTRKPPANRRWCKICKLWLADNKIQVEQHEAASKHKEALATLLKEIARKNEVKAEEAAREEHIARTAVEGTAIAAASKDVSRQLLESAQMRAASTARMPRTGEVPTPNDNEEEVDSRVVCGSGADDIDRATELVDENGYPLAASLVYGQWRATEEDDVAETFSDDVQHNANAARLEIVDTLRVTGAENCFVEEDSRGPTATGSLKRQREATTEERAERAAVESTFKRRAVPTKRRQRGKKVRR